MTGGGDGRAVELYVRDT